MPDIRREYAVTACLDGVEDLLHSMSENEIKERIFICFTAEGFYPIDAVDASVKPYAAQAKDTVAA